LQSHGLSYSFTDSVVMSGRAAWLKSRVPLPLSWNLNKFSHNQAGLAFRIVLLAGGTVVTAGARDTHSTMPVSVTVRAMARLDMQSTPQTLTVMPEDVARGFVEVRQATRFSVQSNSAQGYALEFMTLSPIFTSMMVKGLDGVLSLGGEGGMVVQRWQHPAPVNLALTYRCALAAGTQPGNYPWPLRLAVRPLESI
jgi:hypothetical protein